MAKTKKPIDCVTPADALTILKTLSEEDARLRERIESMIIDLLGEVDLDELAGEVLYKLDAIQVEDLWDRSGKTRHGYVEPCEESWEMFDEALELFLRNQERFTNLGQIQQAQKYGMAILQGIYLFAHESKSKFKDWAEDAPLDRFLDILNTWKTSFPSRKNHSDMQNFLKKNCPKWSQRF